MNDARHRVLWAVALAMVVLVGAALRLHDLDRRTMGHSEVYVPGVDLPTDWGEPRGRLTLTRTITNSMWEPHPPGWYAGMWAWTKVFGTGLVSVRLPSVLCGVACILLVALLGRADGDRWTALAAAALLAGNGHQIYWAQIARPSTMMCLLGLAGTWLLLRMARDRARRGEVLVYGAVSAVGLVLDYYFWLLFAAHIFWNVLENRKEGRDAPGILRVQMLVVSLASPAVTLSMFQTRAAHFEHNIAHNLRDLAELGFLFTSTSPLPYAVPRLAEIVLPPLGVALFLLGLGRRERDAEPGGGHVPAPPLWLSGAIAALMAAGIAAASVKFFGAYAPGKTTTLAATAALPLVAFLIAVLARDGTAPLVRVRDALVGRWTDGRSFSIVRTMAIVPGGLIVVVTMAYPLFVARHMLIFVPYILLVMAAGIVRLVSRARTPVTRVAVAVLLAVLVAAHVASERWYAHRLHSPEDYAGLAAEWKGELRPDDLILVRDHWSSTPILYYISYRTHHFIWRDHAAALAAHPDARVWTLVPESVPVLDEIHDALTGYKPGRTIEMRGIGVHLYTPPGKG